MGNVSKALPHRARGALIRPLAGSADPLPLRSPVRSEIAPIKLGAMDRTPGINRFSATPSLVSRLSHSPALSSATVSMGLFAEAIEQFLNIKPDSALVAAFALIGTAFSLFFAVGRNAGTNGTGHRWPPETRLAWAQKTIAATDPPEPALDLSFAPDETAEILRMAAGLSRAQDAADLTNQVFSLGRSFAVTTYQTILDRLLSRTRDKTIEAILIKYNGEPYDIYSVIRALDDWDIGDLQEIRYYLTTARLVALRKLAEISSGKKEWASEEETALVDSWKNAALHFRNHLGLIALLLGETEPAETSW